MPAGTPGPLSLRDAAVYFLIGALLDIDGGQTRTL